MPIKYPDDLKIQAANHFKTGMSVKAISQKLQIPQSTVYRWSRTHCLIETPQNKYTPAEFDAMSKHIKKLEHILEIIQLSECVEEIPLRRRLNILETIHKKYPASWWFAGS